MTINEFNKIIETVPSGTSFEALVVQHTPDGKPTKLVGKLEVSKDRRIFWLCYNEGAGGDTAPCRHGYKKSWVINRDNMRNVKSFSHTMPIVNQYEIY